MKTLQLSMMTAAMLSIALIPALAVSDTAAAGTCVQDRNDCVKLYSKGGTCEVGFAWSDNGNNSDNDAEYTNYVCGTAMLEMMAAQ